MRFRRLATSIVALLLFAQSNTAFAQSFPTRPVHIIVPLAAGSAVDVNARLLGAKLSALWGQPVLIDNKPGGDTLIAIQAFTRANDDHTLYFAPSGTFTMHPYMFDSLPYDAQTDFVPIARVTKTVVGIFTPRASGVDTPAKMVEGIKTNAGKWSWSGSNSISDFVLEGYMKSNELDMAHVPYRDLTLAVADLSESRLNVGVFALGTGRALADAGKLNILAVVTDARAPVTPNIPTVGELGFPGLTINGLVGFFGQKGLADGARDKIAADVKTVLLEKDVADTLNNTAQIVEFGGPDIFATAIAEQRVTAAKIAAMGVKARR